ncbi:hypothetical protein M7I_6692 [Glarea lozoyensis 74030]|uniref:Uncharacterized protein n=1 Tax=Glarea lozoyensis (strain ATCC 74030 / MF5533) TaxID=1104152 RepID=H0EV97_GLAL7|nr:hypothetical protein M7I_6692 [Glarea lozoyensis 74030]
MAAPSFFEHSQWTGFECEMKQESEESITTYKWNGIGADTNNLTQQRHTEIREVRDGGLGKLTAEKLRCGWNTIFNRYKWHYIIGAAVTSVFGFMHILQIDPEEGVREPGRGGGIGEIGVDDEDGEEREQDVEADAVEADVGVLRPDDAVVVAVEEIAVLLEDLSCEIEGVIGLEGTHALVAVFGGPVVFGGSFGVVFCYGDVGSGSALFAISLGFEEVRCFLTGMLNDLIVIRLYERLSLNRYRYRWNRAHDTLLVNSICQFRMRGPVRGGIGFHFLGL